MARTDEEATETLITITGASEAVAIKKLEHKVNIDCSSCSDVEVFPLLPTSRTMSAFSLLDPNLRRSLESSNNHHHQPQRMTSIFDSDYMEDSQLNDKPPYFNGDNYAYWKNRMKLFIQSIDLDVWEIIMEGCSTPTSERGNWSDEERKKLQQNAKAMHILFCALGPDEYNRVCYCSNAKEIWKKLEVIHEGIDEVKQIKIDLLTLNYENFKMKSGEDIKAMSGRFNAIINALKGYGVKYTNEQVVRKMVYSLPESWQVKKTAIIEAKNLRNLTLDELIGSLLTHEMMLKQKEKEDDKNVDPSEEVDEEEEMIKLIKRFKRFMKSSEGKRFRMKHESRMKKDNIICYECKRPGHIKFDCPQTKKNGSSKQREKKAHIDT